MTDRDSARRRQRKLASDHRRVAERRECRLCTKCGRRPSSPGRAIRASCGEKARTTEPARSARRVIRRCRARRRLLRLPSARPMVHGGGAVSIGWETACG